MSQLSYAEQAVAIPGMIGDITDGMVKDTMVNGEAAAEIAFGKMVSESAAMTSDSTTTPPAWGTPAKALLPAAGGDVFAGVVLHSHEYDKRLDLGTKGVLPKRLLTVMKKGRVWVTVEEAVSKATNPHFRITVNGALEQGNFRTDVDGGKAVRLYGARFLTETAGAGIALLEFDMAAHRAH